MILQTLQNPPQTLQPSSQHFSDSLRAGRQGEDYIKALLEEQGFRVTRATMPAQRRGIDLFVSRPKSVEVKTCWTKRCFLEFARFTRGIHEPSGLATTEADWWAIVRPGDEPKVYWCRPAILWKRCSQWMERYGQAYGPQERGGRAKSHGVMVPWQDIASVATAGPAERHEASIERGE